MPGILLLEKNYKNLVMKEVLEILGVFALSAVKFGIAGVPAAVFAKFSFFKTVVVTTSGGIAGTLVFTYMSDFLIRSFRKIKQKTTADKPVKPKRKFTATNRLLVKVKQKFGLTGIAIITPPILSFPLGVFIAVRYFQNKQQIILYMAISTFTWSVVLYFFYHYVYSSISSLF